MRYEMNLFHLYLHRIISEDDASLIKYKGHDSTESNTRQDKLLQKALIYISEHLNENISLKEVCSHCGLSVSRFSILFKQPERQRLTISIFPGADWLTAFMLTTVIR